MAETQATDEQVDMEIVRQAHEARAADGQVEHRPAHDAAGNLVFDGLRRLTYDAWNRLARVQSAWRDAQGTLHTGSTIATIEHDPASPRGLRRAGGLNRRTRKMVASSGDFDCTCQYLWDTRWRLLETRNGSGDTLKQHLWGGRYIDELVQVAVNTDPDDAEEDVCDANYYPMQNANFNVLGLADSDGVLVERYEYTPYGRRTVFTRAGDNDALTTAPLYHSKPVVTEAGVAQPYGLCDLGHQGLLHDKEFDLIHVRRRYLDPITGRWTTPDPAGYVDGIGLYEYERSGPTVLLDPFGRDVYCYCSLSKRLQDLGVTGFTEDDNGIKGKRVAYRYHGNATSGRGVEGEIPAAMIRAQYNFTIKGKNGKDEIKNLDLHIGARLEIIKKARSSRFAFGAETIFAGAMLTQKGEQVRPGPWTVVKKGARLSPAAKESAYEALMDIWKSPSSYQFRSPLLRFQRKSAASA